MIKRAIDLGHTIFDDHASTSDRVNAGVKLGVLLTYYDLTRRAGIPPIKGVGALFEKTVKICQIWGGRKCLIKY